jgi:ABC-type transport system substrate-binding protein
MRALALLSLMLLTAAGAARAETVLRIGMTAADIPLTTGQADQGSEGLRFMGYTVYESLIQWDLSSSEQASKLIPALAESWEVDPADNQRWIFKIREGVTFHDGSPFTAEDVIWNFEKILNPDARQYDPKQAAQGRGRIPTIESYKALDPYTLEIRTTIPEAFLPYQLAWIVNSSPRRWEELDGDWEKVASNPSGTGPWKLDAFVPRERAELVKNEAYWDSSRIPKTDRVVLLPLPEANSRVAALRSGQVDWIEAPPPDAVPSLEAAGFQIVTNVYPHNWQWHFSMLPDSPWTDVRVRKAANLALDRDGLYQLLGGVMQPAKGMVPTSSPWFGEPEFDVVYDPAAAKALLAEAGYGPDNPVKAKALISASGSGQMQPLPMNEFIQQSLGEVGIEIELEVVEWNTLLSMWRAGAKDPASLGAHSINVSYFSQDPFTALVRHLDSTLVNPNGTNWGWYQNPEMDALFTKSRTTFDPDEQNAVVAEIHEKFVDEALFLFVAHDLNPRALAPKVKGFVQAQNWYQDLTPITIEE